LAEGISPPSPPHLGNRIYANNRPVRAIPWVMEYPYMVAAPTGHGENFYVNTIAFWEKGLRNYVHTKI